MEMFAQRIGEIELFFQQHPYVILFILIWSLVWKGVSMWKAARLSHSIWFVILLVTNTVGILDIIYIYFVANKYTVIEGEEEVSDTAEGVDDAEK